MILFLNIMARTVQSNPSRDEQANSQNGTPRVPKEDRIAMFNSMKHFIFVDKRTSKGEQILELLERRHPHLWGNLITSIPLQPDDLSDEAIRDIKDIVYERHQRQFWGEVSNKAPQYNAPMWMLSVNDEFIHKLTVKRWDDLQAILLQKCRSLQILGAESAQKISPSSHNDDIQLFIFNYLRKYLPKGPREELLEEEYDRIRQPDSESENCDGEI